MQIQNWLRQLGHWLLQAGVVLAWVAALALLAGVLLTFALQEYHRHGFGYLVMHWTCGTLGTAIAIIIAMWAGLDKTWYVRVSATLHDGSFQYWAITGTIFYLALGWAVTSWPPGSWISLLGWIAAVIACLAMICLWIIGIVIMAVNHHEREFNCWLESDERGTEM